MRIAKYLLFCSIHHVNVPENLQSSSKREDFILESAFPPFSSIHNIRTSQVSLFIDYQVLSMPLLAVGRRVGRSTMSTP